MEAQIAAKLGFLAKPSDVADAILFLASGRAACITGVSLPVDGGSNSGMRWDEFKGLTLTESLKF